MNDSDIQAFRIELLTVANAMISGEIELIEGVRRICNLRFKIKDPDNKVFFPLVAIESDTDHFPIGEVRSKFSSDFLRRTDTEKNEYLLAAKVDIVQACQEIVKIYSDL